MDVLECVSGREHPEPLRPTRVLWILQRECGISFVETRRLFGYFGPDMTLKVDTDLINERWRLILDELADS
ncbi:hypothetical protein [Nocardia crassostreae]|uniref:hypothetical protein n=1 Tax=Nocardia crassostreae TaxID=53428 RepID=UPI0012FA7723|nr:hypothetical protein [Nocardia crassostreae]